MHEKDHKYAILSTFTRETTLNLYIRVSIELTQVNFQTGLSSASVYIKISNELC